MREQDEPDLWMARRRRRASEGGIGSRWFEKSRKRDNPAQEEKEAAFARRVKELV